MKALTTLAAALALIAGMSVANAQSSMSKDKTMGKSAEVIGTNKYCTKAKTGELTCNYASLQACKDDAKGADCVANPQTGTTGAGGESK